MMSILISNKLPFSYNFALQPLVSIALGDVCKDLLVLLLERFFEIWIESNREVKAI